MRRSSYEVFPRFQPVVFFSVIGSVVVGGGESVDLGADSLSFGASSASSPPSTGGRGAAAAISAVRPAVVRRGARIGPEAVPPPEPLHSPPTRRPMPPEFENDLH